VKSIRSLGHDSSVTVLNARVCRIASRLDVSRID
jgi:hypothetical protein